MELAKYVMLFTGGKTQFSAKSVNLDSQCRRVIQIPLSLPSVYSVLEITSVLPFLQRNLKASLIAILTGTVNFENHSEKKTNVIYITTPFYNIANKDINWYLPTVLQELWQPCNINLLFIRVFLSVFLVLFSLYFSPSLFLFPSLSLYLCMLVLHFFIQPI